jgi:SNF2 family DNA or RNA helicase
MKQVHAEVSDQPGRIAVRFPYDPVLVTLIKEVPGRSFVKTPDKHWNVPLDLATCHELRELFGKALTVGPELKAWAWAAIRAEERLGSIAASDTAELPVLDAVPAGYEALVEAINNRPYQRVGARFVADSPCPLIADEMGLGKTLQAIAGIAEAGLDTGPMLAIAPKSTVDTVWAKELARWQPHPVHVATGTAKQRKEAIDAFLAEEGPRWLVINPTMMQPRSVWEECPKHEGALVKPKRECQKAHEGTDTEHCVETEVLAFPELARLVWKAIVSDEVHRPDFAITNVKAKTARGLAMLHAEKRIATSGTPMRGKAVQLFGVLKWLTKGTDFQGEYSSAWRWQDRYVVSVPNPYATSGKTFTGRLRSDREQDLYARIRPYMLRRTKAEVASDLPEKLRVPVWCKPTAAQAEQYSRFVDDAEIHLPDGTVRTADGVLAELTRARQMAVAPITNISSDATATLAVQQGAKWEPLVDKLTEAGVFDSELAGPEVTKAVIFSQWASVVEQVADGLREAGAVGGVAVITGATSQPERLRIVDEFQTDDGPRVIVMTTTAGGVGITLDRADSVHFLDETWEPTDQEQAEDRIHRISRVERTEVPATVFTYRTEGTVDQVVYDTNVDKAEAQKRLLDDRRGMLATTEVA